MNCGDQPNVSIRHIPQHWMRVIKQHISRIDITKKWLTEFKYEITKYTVA
jgi:hypothetical protein